MLRAFVDRPNSQSTTPQRRIEVVGSVTKYTWDWAPYEAAEGVTVSSVAWSSTSTGCIGISGTALSASVSSGFLTAAVEGSSLITLTATTSGTQKAVRQLSIRVIDPSTSDPEPF